MNLRKLDKHLQGFCEGVAEDIRSDWEESSIQGNAEVVVRKVEETNNVITYALEGTGQKAWIGEFGKGSKMFVQDENVQEYLEHYSNLNPMREGDPSILGRPLGSYEDLDGNVYEVTTGRNVGRNLEEIADILEDKGIDTHPIEPQFIMWSNLRDSGANDQMLQLGIEEEVLAWIEGKLNKHH